ncbi:carboxylating nicotinate-nucleotide diphosphorylase [Candidatus Woesearchaeota archaeon]|nr:carboxylating nicotinate-nucleotide diphosphorylase [Candidatus Woesearchaeota archaeon]
MRPDIQTIKRFLAEDIGEGDRTAEIIAAETRAVATVITRDDLVLCGRDWFDAVFACLDSQVMIRWQPADGEPVAAGGVLCELEGPARALLTGERTGLNLLQTLSGTATLARHYARAIEGTPVRILDTRKTIPGLREAQKYAVRCGGCHNHRMGLHDGILIKENHILAAGSITQAVRMARALGRSIPVEVEVETPDQLPEALNSRPDRIMLDNFALDDMRRAVELTAGQVELEVSGNVTLDNLRAIANTGVDCISVGALTKNLRAADLSMRIQLVKPGNGQPGR